MLKIIFLLLIVVGALVAWRIAAQPRRRDAPPPPPQEPQRMVACAECAVNLPESEALAADGLYFCDAAHRSAYQRRRH